MPPCARTASPFRRRWADEGPKHRPISCQTVRQLAIAAVAILLLPLASAEPLLAVGAVRSTNTEVTGPLAAGVVIFGTEGLPGFSLSAARIHGFIEETRIAVSANPIALTPENRTQVPVDVQSASSTSIETVAGGRILITGLAGIITGTPDVAIPGIAADDMQFNSDSSAGRAPTVLPAKGAIRLEPTAGTIRLVGDFQLVVWYANFTVTGNVTTRIVTGMEREPLASGMPPLVAGPESTVGREAYLTIEDGVVELPAAGLDLFCTTLDVTGTQAASSISLDDVVGSLTVLGRALTLQGQDVVTAGEAELSLEANGATLQAAFSGSPDVVTVDGVAVQPVDSNSPWFPWMTVGLLLLIVGLVAVYHFHSRKNLRVLDALMGHQDFGAAMVVARRLQRFRRYREEGAVAEAICHVRLGDLPGAKRVLAKPSRGRPRGGRLFLQARIAAEEGRRTEAIQFLASCLQQQPAFAADAAADPFLGSIVDAARQRNAANVGGYA